MSIVNDFSIRKGDFSLEFSKMEIPENGISILRGPSGCGKTTFLRSLLGLEKDAKFSWTWPKENVDLGRLEPSLRRLGVVFQDSLLFPHLSVQETLSLPEKSHSMQNPKLKGQLVELLDLQNLQTRKVHVLSGGEQQRVALALALMTQPRMLLLDEPFASLDPRRKEATVKLLREVEAKWKIPILVISHAAEDLEILSANEILFPPI